MTAIQEYADANPDHCGPYAMKITHEIMWSISGSTIDEEHVSALTATDLSRPILAVNHDTSFGYMRIIDGHHRLTRLARDGNDEFSLFLVPEQRAKQFFQVMRRPKLGKARLLR